MPSSNVEMSSGNVEETSPPPPPIYRELSATIQAQLNIIVASTTFADDATLEGAFGHVKQLAKLILDAPNAVPQWWADDLEEQLATAMRINNRLATLEGPTQGKANRIPDPPVFEGTHEGLEGFVAQLWISCSVTLPATPHRCYVWVTRSIVWQDALRLKFSHMFRMVPSS